MDLKTKTNEAREITKDDISGLRSLAGELSSVFRNSAVAIRSTELDLGEISARVEVAVSNLERNHKRVAAHIFRDRSEGFRTLEEVEIEVDGKVEAGGLFNSTLKALSKDLALNQKDLKILLEAFKIYFVQFGKEQKDYSLLVSKDAFDE